MLVGFWDLSAFSMRTLNIMFGRSEAQGSWSESIQRSLKLGSGRGRARRDLNIN